MPDLLTTAQVARLARIHRNSVRAWADRRGIAHIRQPGTRRHLYPAGPVRDAATAPARHRLARFIANPLNH